MTATNHELCNLFHFACHSGKMDFGRMVNLCHLIMRQESVSGDVVEFGCHKGETAVVLASMTDKQIWLYDSFRGLPQKSAHDIVAPKFDPGNFKCARHECVETFRRAGFDQNRMPIIKEGWFYNLQEPDLPDEISFAHIDADYYESTNSALGFVWWKLAVGGVCVIDDYSWPGLPGVKKSVDEFTLARGIKIVHPRTLGYPAHQCWFFKKS